MLISGEIQTREGAQQGMCLRIAGGAISWASKLQATVAASTTEAEYMAAAQGNQGGIVAEEIDDQLWLWFSKDSDSDALRQSSCYSCVQHHTRE
jgi:hypothetical protein